MEQLSSRRLYSMLSCYQDPAITELRWSDTWHDDGDGIVSFKVGRIFLSYDCVEWWNDDLCSAISTVMPQESSTIEHVRAEIKRVLTVWSENFPEHTVRQLRKSGWID